MSKKKSAVTNPQAPKAEAPKSQETPAEALEVPESQSVPEAPPTPIQTPTLPLTLKYVHQELETLMHVLEEHTILITQLQETLARKRKPVASNGKVQILDKQTGAIFPSKNNAYQTLLKSGELKDLVDKGIFGVDPAKNTFGWYALKRELPDRFEEVREKTEEIQQ